MRHLRARRPFAAAAALLLWSAAALADLGPDDRQISLTGPPGSVESDAFDPAVAFDPGSQRYLAVWSADDDDGVFRIHGRLLTGAAGAPVGEPFLLDDSLPADRDQRSPAVAVDPSRGRFYVVWSADVDAPGAFEIYGRGVDADGTLSAAPVRLSAMGAVDTDPAVDAVTPDVIRLEGTDRFAVAWAGNGDPSEPDQFNIYGQLVDAGTLSEVLTDDIELTFGGNALEPALASDAAGVRWLAVFEYDISADGVHDPEIVATGVSGDVPDGGGTIVSAVGSGFDDGLSARNPDLIHAASSGEFFCVFDGETAGGRAVYGQRLDAVVSLVGAPVDVSSAVPPAGGGVFQRAQQPAVVVDPWSDAWFITWRGDRQDGLEPADYEVWSCRFDDTASPLDAVSTAVSAMDPGHDPVADAGPPAAAVNGLTGYKLVVWAGDLDSTPGGENEIFAQALGAGDGTTGTGPAPAAYALHPAAPNPFNPATVLAFDLPDDAAVSLHVFDAAGRRVRTLLSDAPRAAGANRVRWNGRDDAGRTAPAGVYLYRLDSRFGRQQGRMTLLK